MKPHSVESVQCFTSLLMWIRFCWYLKNMRLGWAKFVLMIEQIVRDLMDNRSQRTEQNLRAELAATREKIDAMEAKIDTLTKMLQTLIDKQP